MRRPQARRGQALSDSDTIAAESRYWNERGELSISQAIALKKAAVFENAQRQRIFCEIASRVHPWRWLWYSLRVRLRGGA